MKRRDLLMLTLTLSSCIGILPKHGEIIKFVPVNFSKGIKIIINEIPRGIGKNVTIVECYDIDKQKMLKKEQVGWKTTVGLELNNGTYIIKTYCPYLGKIIYPTEDKVTVDNNIISIEIKYPALITGKAKVKITGGNNSPDASSLHE